MPSSYSALYTHVVFSTKNRNPWLTEEIQTELYPYLGGALNKHKCTPLRIGGVEDHVHLFLLQHRTVAVSDLLESIKSSSSLWIKEKWPSRRDFAWQVGYGSFSVGPRDAAMITNYIQNQKEHHKKFSFKEEFVKLLQEHRIEYDERYLWE